MQLVKPHKPLNLNKFTFNQNFFFLKTKLNLKNHTEINKNSETTELKIFRFSQYNTNS